VICAVVGVQCLCLEAIKKIPVTSIIVNLPHYFGMNGHDANTVIYVLHSIVLKL
jgi:hypothetical protein